MVVCWFLFVLVVLYRVFCILRRRGVVLRSIGRALLWLFLRFRCVGIGLFRVGLGCLLWCSWLCVDFVDFCLVLVLCCCELSVACLVYGVL